MLQLGPANPERHVHTYPIATSSELSQVARGEHGFSLQSISDSSRSAMLAVVETLVTLLLSAPVKDCGQVVFVRRGGAIPCHITGVANPFLNVSPAPNNLADIKRSKHKNGSVNVGVGEVVVDPVVCVLV
jgi:hypothetical protein